MASKLNPRGTSNHNQTGSSHDRRRRRQWLVETFGDGLFVACRLRVSEKCAGGLLTVDTVTVDRIRPGVDGGTYRRDNIQPACGPCNSVHGNLLRWGRR
jgi:hypothetical protein